MIGRVLLPALASPDVVVTESRRLADAVRTHRTGPTVIVPCIVPATVVVDPPSNATLRIVGVGGLILAKGRFSRSRRSRTSSVAAVRAA